MAELLTAAQMRAIEGAAIESGCVSGKELMERAGQSVVAALFEAWPELSKTDHRAVVLCGPGNNGGDGYVIARLLFDWGWQVEVFEYSAASGLPPDAAANQAQWRERGQIRPLLAADTEVLDVIASADVLVDALFGTGLTRGIDLPLNAYTTAAITAGLRRVAVDMPSGICSDSGRAIGGPDAVLPADLTVTFHKPKLGHVLSDGGVAAGHWVIGDIGLGAWESPTPSAPLIIGPSFDLRKSAQAHKYDHGHAFVVAGPSGKGGAARLAARAALRVGAGLVTVGCPPDALGENAAQLTAIMLEQVADEVALSEILKDPRKNAIAIGPGLGVNPKGAALLRTVLERGGATVLDADALSLISQDKSLFDLVHRDCVLTPHSGEFARLFPDLAAQLNVVPDTGPASSKLDATKRAAKRMGCVVVFKGADTVAADGSGQAAIHAAHGPRSAPWLATAGTGDVLAGMIVGLMARGAPGLEAAKTAVWMHSACAVAFGPGLIAEDLPEMVPEVLRGLDV